MVAERVRAEEARCDRHISREHRPVEAHHEIPNDRPGMGPQGARLHQENDVVVVELVLERGAVDQERAGRRREEYEQGAGGLRIIERIVGAPVCAPRPLCHGKARRPLYPWGPTMETGVPRPESSRAAAGAPAGAAKSPGTAGPMSRPIPPTEGNPDSGSAPMEDAEDVAIVRRILLGERDLFRILVERHQDHVYRLALRLSNGDRDRAADLAQDAFLRAYRGSPVSRSTRSSAPGSIASRSDCAISEKRRERASKRGAPSRSTRPRLPRRRGGDAPDPRSRPRAVRGSRR